MAGLQVQLWPPPPLCQACLEEAVAPQPPSLHSVMIWWRRKMPTLWIHQTTRTSTQTALWQIMTMLTWKLLMEKMKQEQLLEEESRDDPSQKLGKWSDLYRSSRIDWKLTDFDVWLRTLLIDLRTWMIDCFILRARMIYYLQAAQQQPTSIFFETDLWDTLPPCVALNFAFFWSPKNVFLTYLSVYVSRYLNFCLPLFRPPSNLPNNLTREFQDRHS